MPLERMVTLPISMFTFIGGQTCHTDQRTPPLQLTSSGSTGIPIPLAGSMRSRYHLWCTPPLYSTSHEKPMREPAFQVQSQTPCILGTTSCVLFRISQNLKEAYKREYLRAGVSRPGTTQGPCYKRELDYRFQ